MIPQIICWISLPEIGYIVGIAVILFGCKAVSQNPFISKKQKILWMLTILFLNWIGYRRFLGRGGASPWL